LIGDMTPSLGRRFSTGLQAGFAAKHACIVRSKICQSRSARQR
jgi:hypothetical protein